MTAITRDMGELAGSWVIIESTQPLVVGAAPTQILAANPLRWAVAFSCIGLSSGTLPNITLGTVLANVNNGFGFHLSPSIVQIDFEYRKFPLLPGAAWFAALKNATGNLTMWTMQILAQQ